MNPKPNLRDDTAAERSSTILAVDDDAVTRRVIRSILERNGYSVETASNAEEVFEKLQRTVPALLILDVMLPGASGYDLCRALKKNQRLRNVPVVFLTGNSAPHHYKEGLEAGGIIYLAKPVREDRLLRVTRMFLSSPALSQPK